MDTSDAPTPNFPLARLTAAGSALRLPPPPPAVAKPAAGGGLLPKLVLRGVLRHWWQALTLWVLGTGALGALIYTKYEPEFSATGVLRAEPPTNNLFDQVKSTDSTYMATQVQLLQSSRVLSTALQNLEGRISSLKDATDAEAALKKMLQVNAVPGTFLIQVSANAPSPTEAHSIVDEVIIAFLDMDEEWADAANKEQIGKLDTKLRELVSDLENQKVKLRELTAKADEPLLDLPSTLSSNKKVDDEDDSSADQPAGQQLTTKSVDVEQYAELLHKQTSLEFELIKAKAILGQRRREIETVAAQPTSDSQIKRLFKADPEVAQLVHDIQEVRRQTGLVSERIKKGNDPTLRGYREKEAQLLAEYEQLWQIKRDEIAAELAANGQSPEGELLRAEHNVSELELGLKTTREHIASMKVKTRAANTNALDREFLRADYQNARAMHDAVDRRLQQLKYDQAGSQQINRYGEVRANLTPVNNKRNKLLAVAPVAVLGLILGLFTLLELRGARVGSPDELSARVPVEVFSVPPLPVVRQAKGLKGPRAGEDQFELFVQQLDHLRVALCGEATQNTGRGRCVLITSAAGGEGKTTLAAQLAVRCAEAGASTVLIDADLRRATLGRLFEVPECPGLSDVLRGEANLEDALVPISQVGGCQLLPAGSPESNPNRILRGQRFAPMLEQLRRTFDVIIIDTSPVLPVPDALIMGRYADGVVLAARHDRSRFPLVERANTLLTGAGIPVLGVVINGVQPSGMRYGQYTYTYRSERTGSDEAQGRVG